MVTLARLQFYTTVTTHVAVNPPLFVRTVMVAVPAATPRTTPVLLTLATRVFELDHLIPTLDAFSGVMVVTNLLVAPRFRVRVVGVTVTPVTGVTTDTVSVANLAPSTVVTRIVAVPFRTAVIRPSASTVATDAEELDHVTSWFVAVPGFIVGTAWNVWPIANVALRAFRVTLCTLVVTSTVLVPDTPNPLAFAVIVAVPLPVPVTPTLIVVVFPVVALTSPLDGTVAIDVFEEDHVIADAVKPGRVIVADIFTTAPEDTVVLPGFMVIRGGEFTRMELVAVLDPFCVVTVTVAGPGETPVTRPV